MPIIIMKVWEKLVAYYLVKNVNRYNVFNFKYNIKKYIKP